MLRAVFPIADPELAPLLCENIARACAGPVQPIVVTQGACELAPSSAHVLHIAECSLVAAMATAIEHAQRVGAADDWIAKCDPDDFYGAGYFAPVLELGAGVEWSGICAPLIRLTDGRTGYPRASTLAGGAPCPWGGTVAARARCFEPWAPLLPLQSDDESWAKAMQRRGYRYAERSSAHYIHQRRPGSLSAAPDAAIAFWHAMHYPDGSPLFTTADLLEVGHYG